MEKIKEAKLIIIGNDKNNTIIEEEGNYSIVNLTNEKKRINILENDEIIESYILFSLKTCFIKINSNKVININEYNLDKFVKSQKLDIKIFNAVFNKVIKCVNELKYEDKSLQTDDYISD